MDASELHGSVGGAQWTNVQDPVKQMITAITKAVRTQSAGIKDLDRRLSDTATVDLVDQRLDAVMQQVADQLEAQLQPLWDSLKKKAGIADLSSLEKNTISMAKQLDKINELLHSQNHAILNLNDRVSRVTADVDTLKEPNLDRMYQYIDRQTKALSLEIDHKLAAKADQAKAAEASSTLRHVSEDVVPSLLGQVAELKAEMRDVATRSDLQLLANTKANTADLNDLSADVSERVSRADAHQIVNAQINPLVSAITAMEKAIHVQEINIQNSRLEAQKTHAAPPPPRPLSPSRSLTRQQVGDIVEEAFREKLAQKSFVTPSSLDGSLTVSREALLSEVYSRQEALKEELAAGQRELTGSLKRHTDARLQEIAATAREARELNNKAKGAVKDLASNVAKALAKKVDRVDLKRVLKENSAGNKGLGASVAGRDDGPGEFTPSLLNKSHSQWAQSAPRDPQARDAAEAAAPANEESRRNEEELRKQLELIQDHLFGLKAEMNALQRTVKTKGPDRSALKHGGDSSSAPPAYDLVVGGAATSDREWKAALSDLSTNLRRELTEKVGREEMQSTVRAELDLLEARIQTTKKELNSRATVDDLGRVEAETTLLRSQVTGELTGARWLWRSGKLLKEGWIPWDTEVTNAMPNALVWRPSSPVVLTRPAGLYKICVSIFTSLPSVVQVCLNGEPIFTLQPDTVGPGALEDGVAPNPVRDDRYVLRRNRHSDGEVTCMTIDEHVSLPANAKIAVRFNSQAAAQAFFSIKKL